jgi:hypothetical protein
MLALTTLTMFILSRFTTKPRLCHCFTAKRAPVFLSKITTKIATPVTAVTVGTAAGTDSPAHQNQQTRQDEKQRHIIGINYHTRQYCLRHKPTTYQSKQQGSNILESTSHPQHQPTAHPNSPENGPKAQRLLGRYLNTAAAQLNKLPDQTGQNQRSRKRKSTESNRPYLSFDELKYHN